MTEHTTTSDHHTVRAFDSDLQEIASKVAAMGGLAEKQITDAVRALVDHDTELAEHVIAADPTLDAMQREIEQMVPWGPDSAGRAVQLAGIEGEPGHGTLQPR